MGKQDITHHSDQELSLLVFNDEGLYRLRRNKDILFETIEEYFIFTDDQMEILKQDLLDDEAE